MGAIIVSTNRVVVRINKIVMETINYLLKENSLSLLKTLRATYGKIRLYLSLTFLS